MVEVLSLYCPKALTTKSSQVNSLLVPPTSTCFQCGKTLVSYHSCTVKLYTFEGVTEKQKVTLRCNECKVIYNYSQYGDKHNLGFRYYDYQRENVEVNDCVFFHRKLVEFQCCLA